MRKKYERPKLGVVPIDSADNVDAPLNSAEAPSTAGVEENNDKKKMMRKKAIKSWIGFFVKLIVVAGIVWALFTFVFGLFTVRGTSMEPALSDGDLALIYRLQDGYAVGEVVAYKVDGKIYFGRIMAVSGDKVNISDEGGLAVNNASRYEPDIYEKTYKEGSVVSFPLVVDDNSYFILGDRRTSAHDSREFGCISEDDILGTLSALLRRRGF